MRDASAPLPATDAVQRLRLVPQHAGTATPDHKAGQTGSRIFRLDARFAAGGVWAGVDQLVEAAYLGLQEIGENAIVEQHDYELYMALPRHRHDIQPRYLCLTDTAVAVEKTRFYPLERAYRLVHGLVGLVLQYRRACRDQGPWLVIVRHCDQAQHLATRFIAELARRAEPERKIDVIIETPGDPSDILSRMPGMRLTHVAPWIDTIPPASTCPIHEPDQRMIETAIADGCDVALEEHYPRLLKHYEDAGDGSAAAQMAFKVLRLYNRRGYYHEAQSMIDRILPHFDHLVGNEEFRRMNCVSEINSCLVATGNGAQALRLVMDRAAPYIARPHLLANMHYILAMHYLRYLEDKDIDRAENHILQAVDHIRAAKKGPEDHEHAFLQAFINNGLAFLRVRQKRHQEALALCQTAYQSVTDTLGEDRHLLHRSVLQYNMAQVYGILGRLEDSLTCYKHALTMDPFYTEYLTEAGNILQQLGRHREAIEYYAKAIACSPPYPEVYFSKAVSHACEEQWSDALACSAVSLELTPDQPELHAARAEIFADLGHADAALAEYDKAIALDDRSIAMRVNRAVLHFHQGSYERALSDMDDVIARDPREPAHYENRAAIYQAIDRQDLYLHDLDLAARCKEPV